MNRRTLLIGGLVAIGATGTAAGWAYSRRDFGGKDLTPVEAHQAAIDGDIILVDIRRPDEWQTTGVGEGAYPLDMRRDDFVAELDKIVDSNRDRPIAIICARGVRSNRMSRRLIEAGYTRIIDVPEGMLGSKAGPGWLERGLPTVDG
jgi:rhodanese-related sulfurtransferase